MKHSVPITLTLATLTLAACVQESSSITSFEECVAAGNPVMESLPRQCRTEDGQLFVEDLTNQPPREEQAPISIDSPGANEIVASPLTIEGEARGTWYFEASFPIELRDDQGNSIAQIPAQAQGDWMTEDFVPFEATLTFDISEPVDGVLVLKKANASGLPEHDDEVHIPLRIETTW